MTAPLTRNITRVFREATVPQIVAGFTWYQDALHAAKLIATSASLPLEMVVGVIAATSPMQTWRANLECTRRIVEHGQYSGYLSLGLDKAREIMRGTDPLSVLTSQKIANFYRCIMSNGADGVCIDRHAYDIATNTRHGNTARPGIRGARYDQVADLYRRAARILDKENAATISAAQVQSVTWVVWRDRFWAPGALDPKE